MDHTTGSREAAAHGNSDAKRGACAEDARQVSSSDAWDSSLLDAILGNGGAPGSGGSPSQIDSGICDSHAVSGRQFSSTPAARGPSDKQQTPVTTTSRSRKHGGSGGVETDRSRKRSENVRRQKVVPTLRIFSGTFVHATCETPMIILKKWLLGVDGGKIIFSESADNYREILVRCNLEEFERECVIKIEEGWFMMPGFVDGHTQVVPYLNAGLISTDLHSSQPDLDPGSAEQRRLKKLSLITNDQIAVDLFNRFLHRSLSNGITCAAYNGSVVESAARLLADAIGRCRQRAVIGLEIFYGDGRDDTHMFQIIKAKDTAEHILSKRIDTLKPCMILSKPMPEWLETKVVQLAKEMDISVKTTVSDYKVDCLDEPIKNWIGSDAYNMTPVAYHKKCGLLNHKTIIVHVAVSSIKDIQMIRKSGAGVVHCPSADFTGTCLSLKRLTAQRLGIKIGLGTDITTSHSVSMLDTIRRCIQCAQLSSMISLPTPFIRTTSSQSGQELKSTGIEGAECENMADEYEDDDNDDDDVIYATDDGSPDLDQVTIQRLFQMATLGGATGLADRIGSFEVGKDFDAILVNPFLASSNFYAVPQHDSIEEIIEKFLVAGDDRNIVTVYVAGVRVI